MPKPFERAQETDRMVRFLSMLPKKELVDYAKLSEVAEVEITSRTAQLRTAVLILKRDHNQVWVYIKPRIGIQRLDDLGIMLRQREWFIARSRRTLTRSSQEQPICDLSQIDLDHQHAFSVAVIQQEIARDALSRATKNRLERVSRGNSNDLPKFSVVEWAISLFPRRKS